MNRVPLSDFVVLSSIGILSRREQPLKMMETALVLLAS
jgi:hypothetical protein